MMQDVGCGGKVNTKKSNTNFNKINSNQELGFATNDWELEKGFQHSEFLVLCYLFIILSPLFLPRFKKSLENYSIELEDERSDAGKV